MSECRLCGNGHGEKVTLQVCSECQRILSDSQNYIQGIRKKWANQGVDPFKMEWLRAKCQALKIEEPDVEWIMRELKVKRVQAYRYKRALQVMTR